MGYRPKLVSIEVPLQKLLLDPNNPRFLEDHSRPIDEKNFADAGIQLETAERMKRGTFHLTELQKSIESNGWQPVDMIFVRQLKSLPGHYVVLEGNRRLMALRALGQEGKLTPALTRAVDPLSVLEVVATGSPEDFRAQIAYLLGVRHHGSLKQWAPFAQANNIYERYLELGQMTAATFKWDEALAAQIGATLSVDVKKIRERLRVYRAMKQLHEVPEIKKIGVEGKYYSLVREAVAREANSPLKNYIVQDSATFTLDPESIRRMDALCHFSTEGRKGAPIASPEEWRPLAKILKDPDPARCESMIREIEHDKKAPSDVYAVRQAELRQPRWDRWLEEVAQLLRKLQIANIDSDSGPAKEAGTRLATILDSLSPKKATGKE